jgi:hypothetical protein
LFHAGFALVASQRQLGTYPENLEILVPEFLNEVPIDPWSGKPLLYRRTDEGCVVYSVGDNLQDDNGTDFDSQTMAGDIVLRIGGGQNPE